MSESQQFVSIREQTASPNQTEECINMTDDSRNRAGAAQAGGEGAPHHYKVQIDKDFFEASGPRQTGRELLELDDKKPAENYTIYRKVSRASVRACIRCA